MNNQAKARETEQLTATIQKLPALARMRGSAIAYREQTDSGWNGTSWDDYFTQVQHAAKALVALGLKKGDIVCILGFNRKEWTIMALAAQMAGGAQAGIYFTSSAEEILYILNHSRSTIALVENDEQFERVSKFKSDLTHLQHVVMMEGATHTDPMQMAWSDFLSQGNEREAREVEIRLAAISPKDTGTVIYTSGTTGPPKAVVLSHGALAWTAETLTQMFEVNEQHRLLSYLPLAHIAEATGSINNHVVAGYELWFAKSLEALGDHLKDCRPSVFFGVPRVWQKIHETLTQKLSEATGPKAKLAHWAIEVGRQVALKQLAGESISIGLKLRHALADTMVLSKIRIAMGLDQCSIAVSGAAPIAAEVLEFFAALGIVIYEVYGQSEDCGPTTFNMPGAVKIGTVGRPIPGLDVKIAEDDEILVRAPSLFDGYMRDPEATAAVLDNGWMRSGDLGRLDNEGYLTIIGRKKDILITAGGKNITPANLEGDLGQIDLVENAVVCGEGKKFLTALLTLSPEKLAARGLDSRSANNPAIIGEIQSAIDHINERHARVEQIRKFRIINRSLSIEENELTPTLKVKRNIVTQKHAALVEDMYRDDRVIGE